jgi:hypothetical protein
MVGSAGFEPDDHLHPKQVSYQARPRPHCFRRNYKNERLLLFYFIFRILISSSFKPISLK